MRRIALILIVACFGTGIVILNGCSDATGKMPEAPGIVLVGSTPADAEIRSLLHIADGATIDFIRWNLSLQTDDANAFDLNLHYGESAQGTPGFKGDGSKIHLHGHYTVARQHFGKVTRDVYQFNSEAPATSISMVRLDDNIFHLITKDRSLMIGNGGWNYTLTRKDVLTQRSMQGLTLTAPESILKDTTMRMTFVGRTPCRELLKDHNWPGSEGRIKLKWKIVLTRDPATFLPATYTMRRVDETAHDITGKWEIINTGSAIIYRLDSVAPGESISFLVGDANVIFFLDKSQRLYAGNADFSFTLNRNR